MTVHLKPAADQRASAMERIKNVVGEKGFVADPAEMERYVNDWRGIYHGRAALVVRPASTEEVAEVVRICADARIAIVPQSGNTSLCGGSVPFDGGDEIVLSLARMNRVREIDPLNYTITVEAGCILADVQKAAEDADRLFPLSLAAEGSCMIGGNLSTNAGGTGVLRYGNARELVLGLEVVLADGRIWSGLRRLRKDNTGYDLKQIFLGAEGTLGIITAAVLKLFPKPRDQRTALIALRAPEDAIPLLARARSASGDAVTAFEYIPRICLDMVFAHTPGTVDPLPRPYPYYALMELTSTADGDGHLGETFETLLGAAMEDGLVVDAAVAQNEAQGRAIWKLRESIPEAQRHEGASIKHDVAVPVSRVAEYLAETSKRCLEDYPGCRIVAFGHVGDGNLHFNIAQPVGGDAAKFIAHQPNFNRIVHDAAKAMNGSFSAEHGVGRLKREELTHYKSPVEVEMMRRLKQAFDPAGILNPDKVLKRS
jgi:FAD/FMN-containing dehydrogenase